MPTGKHLIAGEWISGETSFTSRPAHGPSHSFGVGTPELVDRACIAAEEAFWSYSATTRGQRAAFLDTIADEIELRGEAISEIGTQETGLPEARLEGERGRTTGQLRLFAQHIRQGDYLDRRHDPALPDRTPLPRPDLKMVQRPIGPVAVFGASNFPLAFSTAGGDTASALAAGCPVVVKGHTAHPGTGEVVAEAIHAAIGKCDIHSGAFSLIQGGKRDVGHALVQHPLISAVGFTGSLGGGRALFDLCAARADPIPFFGELGSVNPMFILPEALNARSEQIANDWAASLAMSAGQFCTNPGIAIVVDGEGVDRFIEAVGTALSQTGKQIMLTDGIASAYREGRDRMASIENIETALNQDCMGREAAPGLFVISGENWFGNRVLGEEVFGPLGLIVRAGSLEQMQEMARKLQGQLTCTLHIEGCDRDTAKKLIPTLERKAGRLLVNGFPTGVEVCDAMVHGGPYPASTNFGATSVGTMAIRRFLRPVCYQNFADDLLPNDLH